MLKELLKDNITLVDSVSSWTKAIELAGEPLLQKGYITQKYIDSIIENVKSKGFYIVISEDVAVPHTRCPEGVKQICLSLLRSKTPIAFGQHDNIRIVFFFGTILDGNHLEMLEALANFLSDNNNLHGLLFAETVEDVINLFNNK